MSLQARRSFLIQSGLAATALSTGAVRLAHGQSYPSGPVRIIVPYGPGGATDTLARLLAHELQVVLGGSFVVVNKGGGGSQIGTEAMAKAAPDGQTLGMIDSAFVINPGLIPNLPYDTRRDLAPLSLTATAQLVMSVHPSVPAKNIKEFIALARAKPGSLSFSSAGVGSAPHLAGEQLRAAADLDVTHVPYKGGSAAFNDLLAGHVQFGFTTVSSMVEHIRAGTVRAMAVTGAKRSPLLPDVPSMPEVGLPSVDAAPLFGLLAPAGVPQAIRDRVSEIVSSAVRNGDLTSKLETMGFTPIGSTPDEFGARLDSEIRKWTAVIKAAGITANN